MLNAKGTKILKLGSLWQLCLYETANMLLPSRHLFSVQKLDFCDVKHCRSELNRLNFRGFYTVLLERNDEMIAVATVR